ncbi:hypothetical protein ACVWWO_005317 [Bradyrhizobium sp. F1.13.1]
MADPAEQQPVDQAAELEVTVGDAIGLAFCRKSRTPAEKSNLIVNRRSTGTPLSASKRWMPITPKTGSLFHAETHSMASGRKT